MEQPGHHLDSITPDEIKSATDELLALVAARLPERFYLSGEPIWRACLTAFIARITGIVESMRPLAHPDRQSDALILLRSLYEHLVTFLWLAVDPEPRVRDWYGDTMRQRRTVALEALTYGVEGVMTDDQLRAAEEADNLKPLQQLARDVDAFWGPRIEGLYVQPASGTKHLLTLEGLYLGIFRLASESAHATAQSVGPWAREERGDRLLVTLQPRASNLTWSGLAIPLFGMALVIGHERLGWPDEAQVQVINDALGHEQSTSDEGP